MFDLGLMYLPFLLFSGVCLENKLFDNENYLSSYEDSFKDM